MQTQSPFGPLLGLPSQLVPPAPSGTTPVSMATFPSAFAAFASQIRNTQLQSLLQSQLQAFNTANTPIRTFGGHQAQNTIQHSGGKVRGTTEYPLRKRVGGSTVKTAKVWRYFDELPTIEQAAECRICRKKIKATNSSTTGMIRHLRSCHVQEYQLVQEARQNSMLVKMEEKARAKLLREMNEKVITTSGNQMDVKKESESQKSPSASSSASDTASSASSSHFSRLPAPVPIKPVFNQSQNQNQNPQLSILMQNIKCEATEVEEDDVPSMKPTDLSLKMMMTSPSETPKPPSAFLPAEFQKKVEEDHKIHMQIALMLLLDQQPSHLIDRPGFRSLFKFLLPEYHLPTGDTFQATIVPQLLNHMKQQIGAIFSAPASASGTAPTPGTMSATLAMPSCYEEVSVNESAGPNVDEDEEEEMVEEEEEENVEIEDDTSSASSSVDADTCDAIASFIHFIGNDVFPHDELISLLSVVTNIFAYFSARPHLISSLAMTVIPSSSPPLLQQVRFVSANRLLISDYIRQTPDMQLLPMSGGQETLLAALVDHLQLQ